MTFFPKTVAEAAAGLDSIRPGWHNEIDLSTLNLYSATNCVLGQLYGTYRKGVSAVRLEDSDLAANLFCSDQWYGHRWKSEILERRDREESQPVDAPVLTKAEVRDAILSADLHPIKMVDELLAKLDLEPRLTLPTGRNALVEDKDCKVWARQDASSWRGVDVGECMHSEHLQLRLRRVIFPGEDG